MTRSPFVVAAAVVLLATPATSQSWFGHAREHRHVPADHAYATDLACGDLDGDGDRDLVIARGAGRILRDDGDGHFTDVTSTALPTGTADWWAVALLDIDADGDLDLFVGTDRAIDLGATDRVFVNDGQGRFTDESAARIPNADERTSAVVVGDVDGDGDLDVVAGAVQKFDPFSGARWAGTSRLYLNDGAGHFGDATSGRLAIPPSLELRDLALADLDGDGRLDLVVADGSNLRLFAGRAGAVFVDETASRVPTLSGSVAAVAPGDVDGDGDADLVVGCWGRPGEPNLLLLNDASGHFALAPAGALPADADRTWALALEDADGDGDLDLLAGNSDSISGVAVRDKLYVNDGSGRFHERAFPSLAGQTEAVALADFDADGDVDACSIGFGSGTRLALGDGSGAFIDAARPMLPGTVLAAADFDADGDVDVIGTPNWVDGARLWTNDGRGVYAMAPFPLPGLATASTVGAAAVADLDADGDPDVVLALRHGLANLALLGDGAGGFLRQRIPNSSQDSTCVALGDVDGDGDVDAVFGNDYGNAGEQNRLFLNDGRGTLTESVGALPSAVDRTRDDALGDVDADGDLDLVAANYFDQSTLALNDGNGVFTDATATNVPQARLGSYALVLGDLDGDGDPDVVLGNDGHESVLYHNDGTGHFVDAGAGFLPPGMATVRALACADLDEDGDLDLGVAYGYGSGPLLLENDGTGHFVDRSADAPVPTSRADRIVALDLDGDRDVDLARGGRDRYGVGEVFLNRLRGIEAPWVPSLGRELRVELHASAGNAPGTRIALPLFGFVRAAPPIPIPGLGMLRIDPAASVQMPVEVFTRSQSPVAIRVPVPANPALVGGEVFAQALVVDVGPPVQWHLTALVAVRIWR